MSNLNWLNWNLSSFGILVLAVILLEYFVDGLKKNQPASENKLKNNNIGYLFIFLSILFLCINFRNSMSVNRYLFEWGINDLIKNYHLFTNNFFRFLIKTVPLHAGDSESGWRSFYYLLPLFIFLRFMGGLSLLNLHLFASLSSIFCLFLFYYLLKKYWGTTAANIGICFFAFSSFFQEFARSASYHAPTVLIALVLIIFIFKNLNTSSRKASFFLGLITGLSWYYYGSIRFVSLLAIGVVFNKRRLLYKSVSLFLLGIIVISLFGFILTIINKGSFFDQENFLYKESGHEKVFYLVWFDNIKVFWVRIRGGAFHDSDISLINKILLIPLIIGIIHVTKNLKHKANRLFLFLILAICVFPIFTTFAHWQLRRYILYSIPFYMLIGVGGSRIIDYLKFIRNKYLKGIFLSLVIGISIFIILSEFVSVANKIWQNKRDTGILNLGRAMSNYSFDAPVFYLQEIPHMLYEADCEAALLTLILKDKNRNYNVEKIVDLESIISISNKAYVIKSPFIDKESFLKMCYGKNLISELMLSIPYEGNLEVIDNFRLYLIKRIKLNF